MMLPIYKDRIPYQFESKFNDILYTFEIHYNSECDFFTIDLYEGDKIIVHGEKMVYNQQLFKSMNENMLPKLTPLDPSEQEEKITYENFTHTVFLRVDDDEQTDEEDIDAV